MPHLACGGRRRNPSGHGGCAEPGSSRGHPGRIRRAQLTAPKTEEAVRRSRRASSGRAHEGRRGSPGPGRSAEPSELARLGGRKVRWDRAPGARGGEGRPGGDCSAGLGTPSPGLAETPPSARRKGTVRPNPFGPRAPAPSSPVRTAPSVPGSRGRWRRGPARGL